MTRRRTLLADVAELRGVLLAMDEWEAAGGDLTTVDDRRCFVDSLDAAAADELGGLALTRLARLVGGAKAEAATTRGAGDAACSTVPGAVRTPRQGGRRLAAQRA